MNGWFRNLQGDFKTHKYRVDIIFLFILCLDILSFENKKISSKKERIERPFHAAAARGICEVFIHLISSLFSIYLIHLKIIIHYFYLKKDIKVFIK